MTPLGPRRTRQVLVAIMALAGPTIFGLDLVLRAVIVGSQPADIQEALAELVTKGAWVIVPGPVLGGVAGFFVYRAVYARVRARAHRGTDPTVAAHRADLSALMFAATIPQVAALLGDLSVMLGARLTPAILTTTLSVIAVLAISRFATPRAGLSRS